MLNFAAVFGCDMITLPMGIVNNYFPFLWMRDPCIEYYRGRTSVVTRIIFYVVPNRICFEAGDCEIKSELVSLFVSLRLTDFLRKSVTGYFCP
jgi:hypothetical protein